MIDHAQRILAQQQQAVENAVMEELETCSAPLCWAIGLAVAAVIVVALVNSASAFVRHYTGLAEVNDAMAQCMNGHAISLGDAAVLSCKVREYKLVNSLAQGEKP